MNVLRYLVAVLLSCFSTAVMSYISMAVPIGPWIDTTLVLCGMIIFGIFARFASAQTQIRNIGLSTAAGALGGILATGIGFSFPTLYFVDAALFNSWLAKPLFFSGLLSLLALAAGSFGLVAAHLFEKKLIIEQQLPFPIGELIYKMLALQNQLKNKIMLAMGFVSTTVLLYVRMFTQILPESLSLFKSFRIGFITLPSIILRTDLVPMFWSVGFITGHIIALPLIVGLLIKILCLEPLHTLYTYSHQFSYVGTIVTAGITSEEFSIAFCSGLVLYGVITSFFGLPKILKKTCTGLFPDEQCMSSWEKIKPYAHALPWFQIGLSLAAVIPVLIYFRFSFFAQIYLLAFTFLWIYQVLLIAGKIGLAPLGRFATFVMVPGMFIFGFTPVQATIVATFVEIAVGVASDSLFGRKMAHLAHIDRKQIVAYQWLGLIISALVVGILFWLLISHFGLGSAGDLPVNKAYTRALLINLKKFDLLVLIMGLVAGYFIKLTKISPPLILGGILMPPAYSLILVVGGLSAYLVQEKEKYYPLASGVFAANSLWMLIKTLLHLFCAGSS